MSSVIKPTLRANRPTILIVEDEVLVRWMMAEELRAQGFPVLEAANTDEALVILQTSTPVSLVITDVWMPGPLDGVALARWVRAARPELKVVICSAQPVAELSPSVADAFFRKPYDVPRVIRRIKELIAGV